MLVLRLTLVPTDCEGGGGSTADGVSWDEVGAMYCGGGIDIERVRMSRFLGEAADRLLERAAPAGASSVGWQYIEARSGKRIDAPDPDPIPDEASDDIPF